jgi:hypothetical protein
MADRVVIDETSQSPSLAEGENSISPHPSSPEFPQLPKEKLSKISFSQLTREIHATLPLGVYALKIIPFECQLDGGTFRALHIKVDLPPEKEGAFARWWQEFESRFEVRLHPTKDWATKGIDNLVRAVAGDTQLLTTHALPALDRRLEQFHRIPQIGNAIEPIPQIPLNLGTDLTNLSFITIDPATTLDREDALYAERQSDDSIDLFISFIDVTWYARRGSPIDRHISARAFSVYGSYSAYPLLGREFSFGPGSFIPNEPRLAWTFQLKITPQGMIDDLKFYRSAVVSRGAYTVDDVQNELSSSSGDHAQVLRELSEVAHRLSVWRRRSDDFVVITPGEGKAARIVSECMITANIQAASLLEREGREGVYTTYALPSQTQQEQLARRIRGVGVSVELNQFTNARDFSALWDSLRQAGQHGILSEMLDRFFPRSLYSSVPNNHQGIPARSYLRLKGNTYVGIVNQWIFEAFAEERPPPFSSNELEKIGHRQNRLMRSYDSLAFQLRFMEMLRRNLARQGELFPATITEIRQQDILFEVDDESFKKWGFARICRDSEDFQKLSLGDKIHVILEGFDRAENRFVFSLAGLDRTDNEVTAG